MREAPILRETLLALSSLQWQGKRACVVWRQNVGTFRHLYGEGVIKIGVEGMADIGGVMADGRALQIECKSSEGALTKAQRNWRYTVQAMGGVHLVIRSSESAVSQVLEALDGR